MEYEKCEFEIIFFDETDIIVTSEPPEDGEFDGEITS
jgi:hypothetical protein